MLYNTHNHYIGNEGNILVVEGDVMSEIDVATDLVQINTQLEQLVGQLNTLNAQRDQLTQQIHNLNGIAMYLRGKQEGTPQTEITETNTNNVSHDEIPDIAEIINDTN